MNRLISLAVLSISISEPAMASDLEDLARQGYAVIEETKVDADFEGCDFDKRIPLANGLVFICSSYNYNYAYNPDVLILKRPASEVLKVIIDDQGYDGTLYKSR